MKAQHYFSSHSLIKMLYWMCEKTNMPPTRPQLVHAIKRNFGGLEESGVDPERMFFDQLSRNFDEKCDPSKIVITHLLIMCLL